jgi:DNA mismatch repair protein MutS2
LETSIRQGQGEVRGLIRRLRQVGQSVQEAAGVSQGQGRLAGETARQAGQRLRQLETEHRPPIERRQHGGWRPQLGERVRLLALGKAAEVLALSDNGQELTVRCGVLRSTVPPKIAARSRIGRSSRTRRSTPMVPIVGWMTRVRRM